MMSKTRLLVVAMLAVMAVSAIAASAAFATPEYLIEGKPFTGAKNLKEKFLTAGTYVLKGEVLFIKTEITCKAAQVEKGSTIEGGTPGKSKANVNFTECTVNKPAGCKVKEPIELKESLDELKGAASPFKDAFKPGAGKPFTEITIEGCAAAGTFKVEGEQECELPKGNVEEIIHKIECLVGGSKLKFGGNAATFSGTFEVELESGEKFSVS